MDQDDFDDHRSQLSRCEWAAYLRFILHELTELSPTAGQYIELAAQTLIHEEKTQSDISAPATLGRSYSH